MKPTPKQLQQALTIYGACTAGNNFAKKYKYDLDVIFKKCRYEMHKDYLLWFCNQLGCRVIYTSDECAAGIKNCGCNLTMGKKIKRHITAIKTYYGME